MAATPNLAATPHSSAAVIAGSAETSLTVPTLSTVIFTAPASGAKIEEITITAVTTSLTPTTVAGLVYLFLYDGATYHLFDTLTISAVTASATAAPFRTSKTYLNMILGNAWSLRASQSVAGNAGLLKVTAIGGDF